MSKSLVEVGMRFDRLTVTARCMLIATRKYAWACACVCGNEAIREAHTLKRAKHVGCKACEPISRSLSSSRRTHGACDRGAPTRLYRIWCGIYNRCHYEGNKKWRFYGGKGIKRCAAWSDFAVFQAWALANGYTDDMTIDRLDSDGDYEPGNCEWVPFAENHKRMIAKKQGRV
jgi:hypothetical protein